VRAHEPAFAGSGTPNRCFPRTLGYWLDHPLLHDDLQGARRIY
jgi:hypothetical protein